MKETVMEEIFKAVKELDRLKRQATALGLFTDDRDLLECSSCGLWEDVSSDGVLIVYQKDDPSLEDSGFRFREADEGRFECPKCKAIITVVAEGDCKNGTNSADQATRRGACHE